MKEFADKFEMMVKIGKKECIIKRGAAGMQHAALRLC
jgi:hypothetical protein